MADHVIVDLVNLLHETRCDEEYAGTYSVHYLLRQRIITITDATDALIHAMLQDNNHHSVILVLDCRWRRESDIRDEHTLIENKIRSISVYSTRNADDFIVGRFRRERPKQRELRDNPPKFGKGDNVFVITDDTGLRRRIRMAKDNIPEQKGLNVSVVGVPSIHSSHPVIPMTIGIAQVMEHGLQHTHRFVLD